MGLNTTTVLCWAHSYAAEVEVGLVSNKLGRTYLAGRTLTLPEQRVMRMVLITDSLLTLGLSFALWRRRAVRDRIKAKFEIDMPVYTVGEYLKRWHQTLQRTTFLALEQKPLDAIKVYYLSHYAPQSNQDEDFNRDFEVKLYSSDCCMTAGALLEKTDALIQFLVNSPERVKSYFLNYSVIYSA